MVTLEDVQNGTAFQLKKASYDDMHDIRNDNPDRIKIEKYPGVIDMILDVLHKSERKTIKSIQLKATTLGTSKIEADPRIATLRMNYESIVSSVCNDDDMKTYSLMRRQSGYIFSTALTQCNATNMSLESRDVAILSDIAKYMGIYPKALFVVSFLTGVRDARDLNTYHISKIDKEISSFWMDVDRRIIFLSMLNTKKSDSDSKELSI